MDDVAADGSPVEVYLVLPAEPDLAVVRSVVPVGASVLDLGSGPGRISNPLVAFGHQVVAVDDSAQMLARVVGAETIRGDVWTLSLGRSFGAVLALSHLINHPLRTRRLDLMRVCREHVAANGVVVMQRYPPDWVPIESSGVVGSVGVRLHDVTSLDGGVFGAAVTYTVGQRTWTQRFTAAIVDDAELASLASASDLQVRGTIGGHDAWVLLDA